MKKGIFEITENTAVAPDVMRMRLGGDCSAITRPGQFVNIALDGLYLRRPISVCDCCGDELTIIYKVVGHGTAQMSRMAPGERLDILSGLGNGYDLSLSGERPLLLGGGVGVPPLYWLARRLCEEGRHVTAVLGFNRADEIFYERELRELGADVIVTTVDGSYGVRGFVTDAMASLDYTYFYTCGPEPMLRAVYGAAKTEGELSFERRMGCGFGACMGCSCKTIAGNKRICREGPVMKRSDIIWEG